jgi:orotate phosphoribosyltransferase
MGGGLMADAQLTDLWVEARSGTFALCGDLGALDPLLAAAPAAGYGLEGHLLAAAVGARAGADGAFIRRAPKRHGTGGRYDGALDRDQIETVLCARRDERACAEALADLGRSRARIVTFEVRDADGAFGPLAGDAVPPPADPLPSAAAVTLLRGQFTLSSGVRAESYWETLPAACRFRLARNLDLARDPRMEVVGVGYGGAYLAAVVALGRGRQPFVVDPAVDGPQVLDRPGVVIDDFVTSGSSFTRVLATMSPAARDHSECVSLYATAGAAASLDWVRSLHVLA